MSKRLDENIGTVGYDGLIVANEPVADVVTVKLAASKGVLAAARSSPARPAARCPRLLPPLW